MVRRQPTMQGAFVRLTAFLALVRALALGSPVQAATERPDPPPADLPARDFLSLEWKAPALECPDESTVRAEVMDLTGGATQGSRHLTARAEIQHEESGWILSLATEVDSIAGQRILAGDSCEALADAAALILALILNPDLVAAVPPLPPHPAEIQPASAPASATARADRPSRTWHASALAGAQMGMLRDVSPTFGLSLGVALGRFSFRLMSSLTPPQNVYTDSQLGLGGRLWLATLATLGCTTTATRRLHVSPCVGVEVTRLHGHGLGVLQPRETTTYWTSADAGLLLGVPVLGRLLIEAGVFALFPFSRPRVFLDEIGTVSQPARLGFRAIGAFGWRF